MNPLGAIQSAFRSLAQRRAVKRDIDDELCFHLEQRTAENIAAGMAPEDAAREARKRFGNLQVMREQCRDTRGANFGEPLWQDVRFGLRMLRKAPGFTAVAVLTLALGLGVNLMVFLAVNDLFLRPLPAREPDQLVVISQKTRHHLQFPFGLSWPDFIDFRRAVEGDGHQRGELALTYSGVMAFSEQMVHLTIPGEHTERSWLHLVSGNYFAVLDVQPLHGRLFRPEEGLNPGADPIIVLTYDTWRTRFGSDPGIVGRPIKLNGTPFTVVGITRPGFVGASWGTALSGFVPAAMIGDINPASRGMIGNRGTTGFFLMARLKPGATLDQAQTGAGLVMARLNKEYPEQHIATEALVRPEIRSRPSPYVATYTPLILSALMGLALLVLAVAIANVTNLLHARAAARERELAVRSALGASRGRLLRQLLVESVLLAMAAGVVGTAAALAIGLDLESITPSGMAPAADTGSDWRVFAFTFGMSLGTGIVTGLLPAFKTTRLNILPLVKDGAPAASPLRHRMRSLLVIGQVAVSCVVLVCAGLAMRSLHQLTRLNLGFQPRNLFLASFDLEMQRYDRERTERFHQQLLEKVRALPGIRQAGLAAHVPFEVGGSLQGGVHAEGKPAPNDALLQMVPCIAISREYLETAGIQVLDGRDFSLRDDRASTRVAIISRKLADHLWPGDNPVGQRVVINGVPREVVGVVANARYWAITDQGRPLVFLPLSQNHRGRITLMVRTHADPAPLRGALQQTIRELDPELPIHEMRTMENQMATSPLALLPMRIGAIVTGMQGMIALLLAALGIFGLVSFAVTRRTREIGIRMAVGATTFDIVRLLTVQTLKLTLIGLACGLALAFVLTRMLAGLLYGVSASDPVVFCGAALVIALTGMLGAWLPVRRASKVSPLEALRYE